MANDLDATLKRAHKEYELRRADADARVVRWEYYGGQAHDPRPFYFERFSVTRGRPLKRDTPKAYAYGFDADGRLAVVRQPKSKDEPAYVEFFARESPARTTSVAYATGGDRKGGDRKPLYAARYDFQAGRLVASDVLDAGGRDQFTERYTYRDGRLAEIKSRVRSGKQTDTHRFDVQYDPADGQFKVLRRYWDAGGCFLPHHWNPAKEPTLAGMADAIRARLIELIPKVVARAKVREPVYCVALEYDELGEELPPTLALGRDADRRRWIEKLGVARAAKRMWVPKHFSGYGKDRLDLGDAALEEDCRAFGPFALSKNNDWIARKVLGEVAAALNKRSWAGVLSVTDDFVVVPTDAEGYGLKKNLKAAAPPAATLQRLQARKFVYERSYT